MKVIKAPLSREDILELKMGAQVLVNGIIYTARDAAHKRLVDAIQASQALPFDPNGQIIYYAGPCPAPPGYPIGSAGPTTSSRMDDYAPALIEQGLRVMIGKGNRSEPVIEAMQKHGAVYLATVGGAGAYLARRIITSEVVAYPELGPECIMQLEVQDFPCIVAIDAQGNNIYER